MSKPSEDEASVSAEQWIEGFAHEIGATAPSPKEFGAILKLAATAAHASERTAAPVACWLAGASGRPLEEMQELAARVEGAG